MSDKLSTSYAALLEGCYDCVDRIVLNGYFGLAHRGAGFRHWWRALYGSDENLDNAHLIRLAGRFSRRLRAWAQGRGVPMIYCAPGERKDQIAAEHLGRHSGQPGVFLVLVSKAPAPLWEVGKNRHLSRRPRLSYVNHYSFHIWDRDWGHVQIKICGHPPFPAQILLNGHEWVALEAGRQGVEFGKQGNCFTQVSEPQQLAQVAEALCGKPSIGRLGQVCDRWIYSACLCFALDLDEQQRSRFRYQYSVYQLEYSRNLLFRVGAQMENVFEALIDRSRAPLKLSRVKTILGSKQRRKYRPQKGSEPWSVVLENPTYDLTVFKVRANKLTLKIYTKGERVLRVEVVVHNAKALRLGCLLEKFSAIAAELKRLLEQFLTQLQTIDACLISDGTLEKLPVPAQLGGALVAGLDVNRARVRRVIEAAVALAVQPAGFTVAELGRKVCEIHGLDASEYTVRQASYDLRKLRAKGFARRIQGRRRYQLSSEGSRALVALVVLRDKVIVPLLAAASSPPPSTLAVRPRNLDQHYEKLRTDMQLLFHDLGLAA